MVRLTRWVLSHKLIIAVFWVIVTFAGLTFSQKATNALSTQFSLPGQKAYETNQQIMKLFHTGGQFPPDVPVIKLPVGVSATSPTVKASLLHIFQGAARAVPAARIVSYATTGNPAFVSADGRTTFGLIFLPPAVGFANPPDESAAKAYFSQQSIDGAHFEMTGIGPLANGGGGGGGPGVLIEVIVGGLGALIVLALVFRSFMAIVPLLMAVIAIPTTFLLVWGLTTITAISFIVQFLVALIGLGVAIDYSLLIVIRWREERLGGLDNNAAVLRAMETAGVSVVFSGTTVAIGLFALVALPVP
ncbi:MAG TPA: MMPL family transporter, partial [Chloroflexota bacterium]|nr:MMPL family transporter [Chloroflexota bacterium]